MYWALFHVEKVLTMPPINLNNPRKRVLVVIGKQVLSRWM